ncbi:MAG: lysoplasmalogenase [Defluviitaleaceae bacterium]|nr:lysoplasmalogenase [Defluviitaleaceae bacterium]MCL2274869.1 lysoplasmalogenase [Defluviitaleaceae bacterium]
MLFPVLIPLFALAALFAAHDYIKCKKGETLPAALLKGACTTVCLGVYLWRTLEMGFVPYIVIFAAALALCIAADVVICFKFKIGVAFFGAAHLVFIAAFMLGSLQFMPFLFAFIGAFLMMLCLVWRWGLLQRENPVYLVYLILLAGMLGLAVGRGGWVIAGAVAFAASDMILIYCRFVQPWTDKRHRANRINLALYFAGIFMLAVFY